MTTHPAKDETQIRQLIADVAAAICAKDVDRIMSFYAADIVVFDIRPPYRISGSEAWRKSWENVLPYIAEACQIEARDVTVFVSGDLALAHWLFRFTAGQQDQARPPGWLRITSACRRDPQRWQIVHEHLSVPIDPETSQAAFALEL